MSSFSVFDFKGGEFRGPTKYDLHVVMVREREDSGLWIAYVMGEFIGSKA